MMLGRELNMNDDFSTAQFSEETKHLYTFIYDVARGVNQLKYKEHRNR